MRVPDDANVPFCPEVDLHVPRGAKRGYDAGAMVRALRDIPGWRQIAAILPWWSTVFALADAVMELAGSLSSDHCFWGQGGY